MGEKEFQFLFSKKIDGDSIIQLKDGKILFYHFRFFYNISIYNEKTFQKLYEINLIEFIKKYEEEKKKKENLNNEEYKRNNWEYDFCRNKVSIKEINNESILIGFKEYLIELKQNNQTYDCKIVKKITDDILELNILSDKRIIIFTKKNILILFIKDGEYIIKEEYLTKDNWKSVTKSNPRHFYGEYDEFFSSYELPNTKLLLNSFSKGTCHRKCGNAPLVYFSDSKIIFINLATFEEIISTEIFNKKANYIVIKNFIIIQVDNNFTLYDINSLKIVKKIYLPQICGNIEKICDKNLIAFSEKEKKIIIYTIEDNDLNEKYQVKGNLIFKVANFYRDDKIKLYNNDYLLALKDKKIIILCDNWIFIMRINNY